MGNRSWVIQDPVHQAVLLDALELLQEIISEDPGPRTEGKPYTEDDVQILVRNLGVDHGE